MKDYFVRHSWLNATLFHRNSLSNRNLRRFRRNFRRGGSEPQRRVGKSPSPLADHLRRCPSRLSPRGELSCGGVHREQFFVTTISVVLVWCLAVLINMPVAHAQEEEQQKRNVLLICIDDLRPELNCFGVNYMHSPHIDAVAADGSRFMRHYVQAPTCGASRFTLLTGRYGGAGNHAIFQRAASIAKGEDVPPSMPAWFRQHGYRSVSVGKVSHHPGGRGGPDWDDPKQPEMPNSWDAHLLPAGPWQHPRGAMHGLAHGEIRVDASKMDLFQSAEGGDDIYPDGLIVDEALRQIETLARDEARPFFLAVGIIRPHLPFGAPAKYLLPYRDAKLPATPHAEKPDGRTTWHRSGEFMKYNRWGRNPNEDAEFAIEVRKHYAACVTYADAQVGRLVAKLKATGRWEDTIVVIWGDHGWHLGEHAIWGKHALFEESLHSPLVVRDPAGAGRGVECNTIVETIDLFPTLCALASLPVPEFAMGANLTPLMSGKRRTNASAISYFKDARTIRTDDYRLIAHRDGFVELYDHRSEEGETLNVAARFPEVVTELTAKLDRRLPSSR